MGGGEGEGGKKVVADRPKGLGLRTTHPDWRRPWLIYSQCLRVWDRVEGRDGIGWDEEPVQGMWLAESFEPIGLVGQAHGATSPGEKGKKVAFVQHA